ncbi:vitelline membrane outer layer protein 1-like [Eleutherodactylus coqui]|uniref:vitelline membrane outer layer protein 1-like n=1 Tax=Eleutherodactylus coqui TaxID=57060 RepID=UPI003461E736
MLAVLLILVTLQNLVAAQKSSPSTISVPNGDRRGTWGPMEVCDKGTLVRGFQLKVERSQGSGDDTSVNAIRLYCTSKTDTNIKAMISSTEGHWGDWTPVTWCPKGYPISFSLIVENPQGDGDDTAVNNVKMLCSDGKPIEACGNPGGEYGVMSGRCSHGICGVQTKVEKPQGEEDDTALNDVKFECCAA